ncbi:MAG TPA: GH92 family glycosyl hydrolase [Streptosporangiaceae bacterium]|nr:GH92 family glycosyl hydrolase [Streptosporangiaceae bacterium]
MQRRGWRPYLGGRAVVVCAALIGFVLVPVGANAAVGTGGRPAPVSDPASLVDPFIGTGSGGAVVGQVDTFPGADVPFGMVQWSPDTPSRPDGGGYNYADNAITGFSLTHLSGPGCPVAGDFPILPATGALPSDPGSVSEPFSHTAEQARPGSYAVRLGTAPDVIGTQITTTERTGLGSFRYPATTSAQMLFKVAGSANGGSAASFTTHGDAEVTGSVTSGHFCGQGNSYTVYFAARFDRPFTASGTWGGSSAGAVRLHPGATSITVHGAQQPAPVPVSSHPTVAAHARPTAGKQGSGVVSGGYVTFDTTKDPVVEMQVAVSYVSEQGALANLASQAHCWNVATMASAARAQWNAQLSKVTIAGGTRAQQQSFYTALYHAMLHPNLFSDADGRYLGFDGRVHRAAAGHAQYANFSGWDVYRSEIPLVALLDPGQAADMATSLLNDDRQGGWLPKWPVANGYTGVMNGDAADPILAEIGAFGGHGFGLRQAVAAMVHGAQGTGAPGQGYYIERPHGTDYINDGYVPNVTADSISPLPNGASETLEYALADFAISRLATAAGEPTVAKTFLHRSQNWANVFDTAAGYVLPRDADGAFPPSPGQGYAGFGQSGFQEGNAAQYTWMVPQDLHALFTAMGGDKAVQARLDNLFTQLNVGPNEPYYWAGNEPGLSTPWAYDSAGAPYKTQATVRQIIATLYSPTPGGEPGNDDLGAMSSWYVWAAMGLYPQTPGVPMLVVGSPLFPSVTVHAGRNSLFIRAPQAAAGDEYIHALTVDGRATQRPWVMLDGRPHMLGFTLSARPSPAWGSAPADAPPSFPAGPVHFPPSTVAFVSASPAQVRVSPGGTAPVTVTVDNTAGKTPATLTWQASAPAGLTVTPSTATVTAVAGATSGTPVTLAPAAGMAPGYYQVALAAKAANGAVVQQTHLLVTVAQPGQAIPTAYVDNYSDGTLTPVDINTGNAGPAIPVGSGPDGEAITPDGKTLYVANNNSNNVTVIDTATNQVVTTVPVGSVAADLAITPDGKTVWVSNFGDGTVAPIDVATNTAGTPVKVGNQAERVAITPGGSQLWVANQGDGTVSVVDLATQTVTATVTVGAAPFGIAFNHTGTMAYVTNGGSNTVSVINTATDTVVATIPVGPNPQGIRVSPDGSVLYVADFGSDGITPVNPATNTAGTFIPTGSGAYQLAFTPDGSMAWVVNTNANSVTPVDVATGQPGTPVTVGNAPDGIAVTPATGG